MCRVPAGLLVLSLFFTFSGASQATTYFFDDFTGSASPSTGSNDGVTFTSTTAVFDDNGDGLQYSGAALFPAEGVIEVNLRVDQVSQVNGGAANTGPGAWSTIIDSAGVDLRVAGDVFLQVASNGTIGFTLSTTSTNPFNEIQVSSTTSILDGLFHTVGVEYGSGGISLAIDGVIEDTHAFTGLRDTSRTIALGDYTDQTNNDAIERLSFIGEVDWIKSSSSLTTVPVPAGIWLFGSGLVGLVGMARRKKSA
jgi:hypothetical protein